MADETQSLMRQDVQLPVQVGATAAAALAEAEIRAQFTKAMMAPRNIEQARQSVLKACRRTRFAQNKSTLYRKPAGNTFVEGAGIRLAEELARNFGNLRCVADLRWQDDEQSVYAVSCIDLETNFSNTVQVTVQRVIERHTPRAGQEVIGQRETSKGKNIYLVRPTDDELVTKTNSLVSKALRNCILRCIPEDIVDEALETIRATRLEQAERDPGAETKAICDGFARIGVMPMELERFLGHPISSVSPVELTELRAIWKTIEDEETSWAAVIEAKRGISPKRGLDISDLKPGKQEQPQAVLPVEASPEAPTEDRPSLLKADVQPAAITLEAEPCTPGSTEVDIGCQVSNSGAPRPPEMQAEPAAPGSSIVPDVGPASGNAVPTEPSALRQSLRKESGAPDQVGGHSPTTEAEHLNWPDNVDERATVQATVRPPDSKAAPAASGEVEDVHVRTEPTTSPSTDSESAIQAPPSLNGKRGRPSREARIATMLNKFTYLNVTQEMLESTFCDGTPGAIHKLGDTEITQIGKIYWQLAAGTVTWEEIVNPPIPQEEQ